MPDITQLVQNLGLPAAHSAETILLMTERHARATEAMTSWAEGAKKCVEFVEGKQWSADDLKTMDDEGRPALMFNKIAPLVRTVVGYHRQNRTDTKYQPGSDGTGTQEVATILTHLGKQISQNNAEPYVDAEVFMDGLITGRGYIDIRLGFEKNDFGEALVRAKDPFSIKLDPDADEYDLNSGTFAMEDRWVNLDEIEFTYGKPAASLVAPLVHRAGYAGMPSSYFEMAEIITPWRTFGGGSSNWMNPYAPVDAYLANAYDPYRKNILLVDCQHYVRVKQRCIIDLETGDREPIPEHFTPEQVKKILDWSVYQYGKRGKLSPLRYELRPMRRVRWTTMIGDIVVYDGWSPYESFTLIPFFPYFRRGQTRGMVDDLIDPQREVNKRRSSEVDIVTRSAHSGWKYHEKSLSEDMKIKLERYGAAPGLNLEWKGEPSMEPRKIEPSNPPAAMDRLEQKASDDLKAISGVNDSLLGMIDQVQSGRAIEARQRGAIIAIQMYMDNYTRTAELKGKKKLEVIQNHYTEQRVYRVMGDSGMPIQGVINQRDEATQQILNNVTLGKYEAVVDQTPLSAAFLSAQFDEMLSLVEKGILPVQAVQDVAVDVSSIPQKDIIKQRVQAIMASQGIPVGDQAGMVPPGMSLPGQPAQGQPAQALPGPAPGVPA